MKLFKFLKKSEQSIPAQNNIAPYAREAFIDHLLGRGLTKLADYQIIQYYLNCAPLADSIDRISREISSIRPTVYNKTKSEYIDDHPVLELLENPNAGSTYAEFITRIVNYFLLMGEVFPFTTGDVSKPPSELFAISPQNVSITQGGDGFAESMSITSFGNSGTFERTQIDRRVRFYDNTDTQELSQIKNFNPFQTGVLVNLRGRSMLSSIYYEIEQWLTASVHNLSLLKRGATLSGILTTDQDMSFLTDNERQKLKEELRNFVEGETNAGRVAFLDKGIGFQSMSQSNKDLDFRESKKDIEAIIYKRMGIPLPFISEQTMTMANRQSARLDFYDDVIIPLTNRILDELSLFLLYRYKNSANDKLVITFDQTKIAALEPRKLEQLSTLQQTNILEFNELRATIGYDETEGGDEIMVPGINVPLSSASDNILIADDNSKSAREKFIEIMSRRVNSDGDRVFTDDEINKIADKHEL